MMAFALIYEFLEQTHIKSDNFIMFIYNII